MNGTSENAEVCVANIPRLYNNQATLMEYFSAYGQIVKIRIPSFPEFQFTQIAYIKFSTREEAEHVLREVKSIKGSPVTCHLAIPRGEPIQITNEPYKLIFKEALIDQNGSRRRRSGFISQLYSSGSEYRSNESDTEHSEEENEVMITQEWKEESESKIKFKEESKQSFSDCESLLGSTVYFKEESKDIGVNQDNLFVNQNSSNKRRFLSGADSNESLFEDKEVDFFEQGDINEKNQIRRNNLNNGRQDIFKQEYELDFFNTMSSENSGHVKEENLTITQPER